MVIHLHNVTSLGPSSGRTDIEKLAKSRIGQEAHRRRSALFTIQALQAWLLYSDVETRERAYDLLWQLALYISDSAPV